MNKNIFKILLAVLAISVIGIAAIGLAACDKVTLQSISLENPVTEFKEGDEFTVGDAFKVIAHYSDGSTADVTASAEIRHEADFDMSVFGSYMVTVAYENKKEVYTIYVGKFDNILRKIELDTAAVKKTYALGDEISYDGIKVNCTYENAQGNNVFQTYTSLAQFEVRVSGTMPVTDNILMGLGEYTVTVSKDGVSDLYKVNVDEVNVSTVQGAIFAGNAFKSKVIAGSSSFISDMSPRPAFESFAYDYEFGGNYTYINQKLPENESAEYHMSVDEKGLFCAKFVDDKLVFDNKSLESMMDGAPFFLWYFRDDPRGVESTLIELYKNARLCTNKDLNETADVKNRVYTFSFSGIKLIGNLPDYYETTVTFALAEDYSVQSMTYRQDYWENNSGLKDQEGYTPTFITDEATGITSPNGNYTYRFTATATQTSGERTKTNPYSRDMFVIRSFDLMYNGQNLGDNGVVDCKVSDKELAITIENINPSTAVFAQDPMYFDCDGYYGGEQDSTTLINVADGFTAFRKDNVISITLKGGGSWKLKIRTEGGISKTITLNVIGSAPVSMSGQIGNPDTNEFYFADKRTVAVNQEIYFYGLVNNAADSRQMCTITSPNQQYANVQNATFGGRDCFKFSASREGVYTVVVSSAVALKVQCVFTFTVSEVPDYANILKGSYSVMDYDGNILLVEFNPRNLNGDIDGSVKITKTPTNDDDAPIPAQAVSQTLEYYVDQDALTVNLSHSLGVNLGIRLFVDVNGKLILEDRYGITYQLNPVVG